MLSKEKIKQQIQPWKNKKEVFTRLFLTLLLTVVPLGIGFALLAWHERDVAERLAQQEIDYEKKIDMMEAALLTESLTVVEPRISARGVLVKHLNSNHVLFARNDDQIFNPASLTKLALFDFLDRNYEAIIGLSATDNQDQIIFSEDAIKTEGDSGFLAGDQLPLEEALGAMMVASSNDTAYALAQWVADYHGTSVSEVLEKLNQYSNDLGLMKTRFKSITGYDYGLVEEQSQATPQDIMTLIENIDIHYLSSIFSYYHRLRSECGEECYLPEPTYPTAYSTIDNLYFYKTGYTDLAGGSIIAVTEPAPGEYYAFVVLGSTFEGRFDDIELLTKSIQSVYDVFNNIY